MKIAVCGKGGTGKSTITSLLAKELARQGKKVLVIDSDESNYGLCRQLGMELPSDFTAYFGGKEKALKDMLLSNFTHQFFEGRWTLQDIPEAYFSEKDGVKLMASGKIHAANEGCACAMGNVITQFVEHLTLGKDEYALMDMEAGIEHFGRGIDNGMDIILMIVDPSYESLTLTGRIMELGRSIHKRVYFVLNKVNAANREAMHKTICGEAEILCELTENSALMEAGLTGDEITARPEEIKTLAERIIWGNDQGNDGSGNG